MGFDVLVQALDTRFTTAAMTALTSSARYIKRPNSTFSNTLSETFQTPVSATKSEPYVVQKGDYLAKIVQENLKKTGKTPTNAEIYDGVRQVAGANGLSDANMLHPGQKLDLSVLTQPSNPPAARPQRSQGLPLVPASSAVYSAGKSQGGPLVSTEASGTRSLEGMARDAGKRVDLTELIDRILNPPAKSSASDQGELWAALSEPAQISSGFGMRTDPFTGRLAFHQGVDLATEPGATIYPVQAGTVKFAGYDSGYGKMVIVQHDNGLESVYGHNAANLVKKGDKVTTETPLGQVGTTGRSTGPHVHLEVRKNSIPVNPMPYLQKSNVQMASNQ